MIWDFEKMYAVFSTSSQELLLDGKWGVEREMQRVTYEGDLALTPHPAAFGDKLKNKEITTDFSESQLELITPPFPEVKEVDDYLKRLYGRAAAEVGDEYLWPLSMPPRLPEEEFIPIAQFDNSKEGQEAYLYRLGLAKRYGKKMQMISGIHFNFSFGEKLLEVLCREFGEGRYLREFTDELYFSVARNFLRYRWLLIYLFGASPFFDDTYRSVLEEEVEVIRKCCPECCKQYGKYAVSLRVSRFGYSNPEVAYSAYYNSKEEYIRGIRSLLSKESRKFAKPGIQLNNRVLQKDSEFYSPIRLKQITGQGESQIDALDQRGVSYAEVRILDIDPFEMTGISLGQMHFLQVFMLYCLFCGNSPIHTEEMKRINQNHHLVALSGRKPGLMLYRTDSGKISLKKWAEDIFVRLHLIAGLLDHSGGTDAYRLSVRREYQKLKDISLLPSARLEEEMNIRKESFLDFGVRKAMEYKTGYDKEER